MLKRIILISGAFLSFIFINCHNNIGSEPFNFEKETPEWLKEKISIMSTDTTYYYAKTRVYRYEWDESFVYHIFIPISSCVYCKLYDQDGKQVQINNDVMLQDFLKNRRDGVLLWESR